MSRFILMFTLGVCPVRYSLYQDLCIIKWIHRMKVSFY